MLAAETGQEAMIEVLLEYGAQIDLQNNVRALATQALSMKYLHQSLCIYYTWLSYQRYQMMFLLKLCCSIFRMA